MICCKKDPESNEIDKYYSKGDERIVIILVIMVAMIPGITVVTMIGIQNPNNIIILKMMMNYFELNRF